MPCYNYRKLKECVHLCLPLALARSGRDMPGSTIVVVVFHLESYLNVEQNEEMGIIITLPHICTASAGRKGIALLKFNSAAEKVRGIMYAEPTPDPKDSSPSITAPHSFSHNILRISYLFFPCGMSFILCSRVRLL